MLNAETHLVSFCRSILNKLNDFVLRRSFWMFQTNYSNEKISLIISYLLILYSLKLLIFISKVINYILYYLEYETILGFRILLNDYETNVSLSVESTENIIININVKPSFRNCTFIKFISILSCSLVMLKNIIPASFKRLIKSFFQYYFKEIKLYFPTFIININSNNHQQLSFVCSECWVAINQSKKSNKILKCEDNIDFSLFMNGLIIISGGFEVKLSNIVLLLTDDTSDLSMNEFQTQIISKLILLLNIQSINIIIHSFYISTSLYIFLISLLPKSFHIFHYSTQIVIENFLIINSTNNNYNNNLLIIYNMKNLKLYYRFILSNNSKELINFPNSIINIENISINIQNQNCKQIKYLN